VRVGRGWTTASHLCVNVGQSYEMKLKCMKESTSPDEQLFKVIFIQSTDCPLLSLILSLC